MSGPRRCEQGESCIKRSIPDETCSAGESEVKRVSGGSNHHSWTSKDVLESKGDDDTTELHEVAAALGISLTLSRTGMSDLTFNLDNEGRRHEIKVDPSDRLPWTGVPNLTAWSGKMRTATHGKKSPFEPIGAAGIHQNLIEQAGADEAAVAKFRKAAQQESLAAPSVSNRAIHRVFQILPRHHSGQVQNGASRACARQAIHPTPIDLREMCGRMDRAENSATFISPKDEDINQALPEAVKAMEASR